MFEVFGIPSDLQSIRVRNAAFKDIGRSQSALFIFKDGFSKDQFILNNDNDHTLELNVDGNTFVEVSQSRAGFSAKWHTIVLILAISAFGTLLALKLKKSTPIPLIKD